MIYIYKYKYIYIYINKYKYKLHGRFRGRKKVNLNFINYYDNFKFTSTNEINESSYNILDIGSGSGENAIFLSEEKPYSKIITCELFQDGNINLLNKIIENKVDNISIYEGNVLEFFDKVGVSLRFDEVWILFPDPWPKIRHHKRRLINNIFLKKIYSFLKNSAKVMIASDSHSYNESIIKTIYDIQNLYLWQNQKVDEWNYCNLNLPKTKFFKKALKLNKNSMFFKLCKI